MTVLVDEAGDGLSAFAPGRRQGGRRQGRRGGAAPAAVREPTSADVGTPLERLVVAEAAAEGGHLPYAAPLGEPVPERFAGELAAAREHVGYRERGETRRPPSWRSAAPASARTCCRPCRPPAVRTG
ncbi:hypothetical protein GCM10010358_52620 [Streptomyces minutiscleroticus]|uniref:Uncharacterized protein n=1 Tax=Streptomyces minutiscleroticus TaxID=68238 RepID=A0A918U4H6_9ACTN|nr:hypothetical protein GCM10010358_52620 [Streptomyces minutiscleroticus]